VARDRDDGRAAGRPVPGSPALVDTVLGPVAADDLGPTLIHEHIRMDLWPWFDAPGPDATAAERAAADLLVTDEPLVMERVRANPFAVRDNLLLTDADLAASELARFAAAGGRTVVDLTLDEIGRDPGFLRDVALRTGLNIVMGSGHYVGRAHPAAVLEASEQELRDEIVRDLTEGVPVGPAMGGRIGVADPGTAGVPGIDTAGAGAGTADPGAGTATGTPERVRAGIIGEIGTSDPVDPREARVLRAACAAQRATGRTMVLHLDPWGRAGHAVLDRCEAAGVDLDRVVLAHLDPSLPDHAYHRSLAARGAWISYDIWGDEDAYGDRGMPTDDLRIAGVLVAHLDGWEDRLLVSQDVCLKSQLRAFGGGGYDHLLVDIAPRLEAAGLDPLEVEALLVDNPRRALAGIDR
jgi:phosphotriesterase-related protein